MNDWMMFAARAYLVSFSGTPYFKLTVPYGIPVRVSKAGSNRFAYRRKQINCQFSHRSRNGTHTTSSAIRSNGPLHGQPGSSFAPDLLKLESTFRYFYYQFINTLWTTYAAANELRWVHRRCEYLFQTLKHLCQNRNSIFGAKYRRHAETQWNCPSQPAYQASQLASTNNCPMYRRHHNCHTNKRDPNSLDK